MKRFLLVFVILGVSALAQDARIPIADQATRYQFEALVNKRAFQLERWERLKSEVLAFQQEMDSTAQSILTLRESICEAHEIPEAECEIDAAAGTVGRKAQ